MDNSNNSNIPSSHNLLDVLKSTVDLNTTIIKTIIKNQALYAASLIAVPIYFKAASKLYSKYASFVMKNMINSAKIIIGGKLISKSIDQLTVVNKSVDNLILGLQDVKTYRTANSSVKAVLNLLNTISDGLSGKLIIDPKKKIAVKGVFDLSKDLLQAPIHAALYIGIIKIFQKLNASVNDLISKLLTPSMYRKSIRSIRKMIKLLNVINLSLIGEQVEKEDSNEKWYKKVFNNKKLQDTKKILSNSAIYSIALKKIKEIVDLTNIVVDNLQKAKKYNKAQKSISCMMSLVQTVVGAITGDIEFTKDIFKSKKSFFAVLVNFIKSTINFGLYVIALNEMKILASLTNELIEVLIKITKRKTKKSLQAIARLKIILESTIEFFNSKIIQDINIRKQIKTTVKLLALSSSLIVLGGVLSILGWLSIPIMLGVLTLKVLINGVTSIFCEKENGDYSDKKAQNAQKSFVALKIITTSIASLLMIIIAYKMVEKLMEVCKLIKTPNDALQLLIGIGTIVSITLIFLGLFIAISHISTGLDDKKLSTVMTALTSFITAWGAAKIAETIAPLGPKFKDIMLGMIVVSVVSLTSLLIIEQLAHKAEKSKLNEKLAKTIVSIISAFVTAWGAAKIAETVSPLGPQFMNIMMGMVVIFIVSTTTMLILKLLTQQAQKVNSKEIKIVTKIITGFITAWVAAKIAETIAPLGPKFKEIMLGILVISMVTITIAATLRVVSELLKRAKLVRVAFGIVAISFAVLVSFTTLAMAAIFAPFAVISMTALVFVAGMAALIGLVWKQILKGSLAMAALGLALSIIASPLLVFGITGAILMVASGGNAKFLLITMAALCGVIMIFALLTVAVGALMNTGIFELGIIGLALLGVAMILIVTPLLIFAIAIKKLSEIDLKKNKDAFKDVIEMITGGVKAIFDNYLYLNPISLTLAALSMGPLVVMVTSLGLMANVLCDIAALKIPIEWNEKGKPTKYRQMNEQDFKNAATNAGFIIEFFALLFSKKKHNLGNGVYVGGGILNTLDDIERRHKRMMKKLRQMVEQVGMMAEVLQNIASLRIPETFDDKGKPKTFRAMVDTDFQNAADNVVLIVTSLVGMFDENTSTGKRITAIVNGKTKRKAKKTNKIMDSLSPLVNITEVIQKLAEGEYVKTWKTDENGDRVPDEYGKFTDLLNAQNRQKIEDNISNLLTIAVNGISKVDQSSVQKASVNTNMLNNIFDHLSGVLDTLCGNGVNETAADKIKANLEETRQLLVQINNTDVTKLKYAFSLMHSISTLSTSIKGNFEGLSKTISEDLIDALKELKDVLEQINGGVQVQTSGIDLKQTSQVSDNGKPTNDLANNQKEGNKVKSKETKEDPNLARIKALLESVIQSGAVNVNQNTLMSFNS